MKSIIALFLFICSVYFVFFLSKAAVGCFWKAVIVKRFPIHVAMIWTSNFASNNSGYTHENHRVQKHSLSSLIQNTLWHIQRGPRVDETQQSSPDEWSELFAARAPAELAPMFEAYLLQLRRNLLLRRTLKGTFQRMIDFLRYISAVKDSAAPLSLPSD